MTPFTIPVAHDITCPWCWIARLQAKRLTAELGVRFDWLGFELMPEDLDWSDAPPPSVQPDRPSVPSRLSLMLAAEGLVMPKAERPRRMRTHNVLQAIEYAKTEGDPEPFLDRLYAAYWEEGQEVNRPKVLRSLAKGVLNDPEAMVKAIEARAFKDKIVGFDTAAYARGVYNVPTFFIGTERYAEQPYSVLRTAVLNAMAKGSSPPTIYSSLQFPIPPAGRPYVYINMVSTIDGKILSGSREESVLDLGSALDHTLMHRIEATADGIMIGAGTLRATPASWIPRVENRIVVTGSGDIDRDHGFFRGGKGFVATSNPGLKIPGLEVLRAGKGTLDFAKLFRLLAKDHGIRRLLVLGGSELNAQLIAADLADELFLTLAPKVKLGRDVPTYADGEALPRDQIRQFELLEHHAVDSELFLRYRRRR